MVQWTISCLAHYSRLSHTVSAAREARSVAEQATAWQHPRTWQEHRQLEVHSVERIYLRQRCFDVSKPRVATSTDAQYQYVGFSRRNKIPRGSAYAMGESNPVPASGL